MIEPIMFFGIGFFVASLFGLVLIPLVHNRAVRLTMKRLFAGRPAVAAAGTAAAPAEEMPAPKG